MHSITSNSKTHIIRAKKGLTLPIIPHLEEGDYVLVDGILAAGKKIVDPTETIYKPLVLAQLIIPFEDTHRSNDPDALCKGRISSTIALIFANNKFHDFLLLISPI